MSWKSSKSEAPDPLPDRVIVGRVRKPHGLRGEVVVDVLSDVGSRFKAGARMGLVLRDGERRQVIVAAARIGPPASRLRFQEVEDRDQAEVLRDALLEVERREVPPAPVGSYYFFELVGCSCVDARRGDLGRVERIIDDGGGLLLEVRTASTSLLVPFVQAYLNQVDVEGRRIEMELPEGLIETCTSRS